MVIWKIGLVILATNPPSDNILGTTKHIEFLRVMMLQHPEEVRSVSVFSFSFRAQLSPSIPPPTPPHAYLPTESVRLTAPATFQRESLVQELVLSLAVAGRERDALDELELCGSLHSFVLTYAQLKQCSYLPSPPYQDNSVLHTYAGLLCLRLALSVETDLGPGAEGTCGSFHNLS